MPLVLPAQKFVDAIHGPVTQVTRRVDIYQADADILWMGDAPFTAGSVTCDQTRTERRAFSLNLDARELGLHVAPGELWYDKIFKIFRGAVAADGTTWEAQIGEFLPDKLDKDRTRIISCSGRDYVKKMQGSKFPQPVNFTAPIPIENLIQDVAANAGITKFNLPLTGQSTGKDFYFDRGTDRWKAVSDIAAAYNWELFFSADGYLTLREFTDPLTSEIDYTFLTGPTGNIVDLKKSVDDSQLYNHIVVTGAAPDENTPPVWAEAINTNPASPTNTDEIGDRVYQYDSQFITTTEQAQNVADRFLQVHALEQFDCNIDSIVVPYMDVGVTVEFYDPDPAPGDPTRYLMSNFTIPLTLDAMQANVKRVTIVS